MTRDDFIYLCGLIMLTAGAGLIYLPACLLVAGLGSIFYALFISPPDHPEGDAP